MITFKSAAQTTLRASARSARVRGPVPAAILLRWAAPTGTCWQRDALLAAHEGKSFAQLQQEALQLVHQGLFEL
jgi:hypothetical protein